MARFTAVILAGGSASRLDGKPFRKVNGQEMVVSVYCSLSEVFDDVYVSIKDKHISRIKEVLPQAKIVLDNGEGHSPVHGMLSSAEKIDSDVFFFVGCDMPFVKPEVISLLRDNLSGHDACMAVNDEGFMEPLLGAYRRQPLIEFCRKAIEDGKYRLCRMNDVMKINLVPFSEIQRIDSDMASFRNINTLEELEEVQK